MGAFFLVVFWVIYWLYVFKSNKPEKQLILTAIGLVAPGGAEILACLIGCYIVYVTFFKGRPHVDHHAKS